MWRPADNESQRGRDACRVDGQTQRQSGGLEELLGTRQGIKVTETREGAKEEAKKAAAVRDQSQTRVVVVSGSTVWKLWARKRG